MMIEIRLHTALDQSDCRNYWRHPMKSVLTNFLGKQRIDVNARLDR